MPRVVLAMSGGVDSSVAALLLRRQGFEVIGLFMRTGAQDGTSQRPERKQGCCSAVDAGDARRVADQLDIPFYSLDFADDFRGIMDLFADEYLAGRTPNPCVTCNTRLKFGKLWTYGRGLDADFIATGHYAQIVAGDEGPELFKAADAAKDQSYVLFDLRRALMSRVLFPIGGYTKEEVRQIARQHGLPVSAKPDSQEICFVPDGDHASFVRRHRPGMKSAGVIRDTTGRVLGTHQGIEQFTVGQRKGLRVAADARRYVLEIVPAEGAVVVGTREEGMSFGLRAQRCNWLVPAPAHPLPCSVKFTYRDVPVAATVCADALAEATVRFAEPPFGVAPGQAAVFYAGNKVLGGGWIVQGIK